MRDARVTGALVWVLDAEGRAALPSSNRREREAYLHRFERHGNRAVLLPFDQTQFNQARYIGMDVRVVALGGFCQRVDAARAFAAQGVEEIQARRGQFGEQRARRLEA